MQKYDIIVIGGGIVGLATALQLLKRNPRLKVALLEKEERLAAHQSGHNSGVIHAGIYYPPDTLKAKNCMEGVKLLKAFCNEHEIPYQNVGKIVMATNPEELPRLDELERRARANGVPGLKRIGPKEIEHIEPAAKGLSALYSPETAVVDFIQIAEKFGELIRNLGGHIFLNQKVIGLSENSTEIIIKTDSLEFSSDRIINCAGLFADKIGHLMDQEISPKQIIPFRGEYYELIAEKRNLIRGLIYPVPDPRFPFLGVHFIRTIHGIVEAGPNAVLAFAREGYHKSTINLNDCFNYLTYKGFWKMIGRYWEMGLYEMYRSISKQAFLKALQRLVPSLEEGDLIRSESGVRSQVVTPDGKMYYDFLIKQNKRAIHILNAPSPAATSALAIGKYISDIPN